jgi:hypothetical protein
MESKIVMTSPIISQKKDISDKDIYILFAYPGERHEDSTPCAFITLEKLDLFVKKNFDELLPLVNNEDDEDEGEHRVDYYMTVMIPNRPIADEGDDNVSFSITRKNRRLINTYKKTYNYDNPVDYGKFSQYIKQIYREVLSRPSGV